MKIPHIKKHLSVESTRSEDEPSFGRTANALAFHVFEVFAVAVCGILKEHIYYVV